MLIISKQTVDYEVNPIGIDSTSPGLSWQLQAEGRNQYQTAYQIKVALSSDALERGDIGDCWDSGCVQSRDSQHVIYQGSKLESCKRYYWKVKVWDSEGAESAWSEAAYWEMGLLIENDWQAEWITAPFLPDHSPEPDILRDVPVIWDSVVGEQEDKASSHRYFRFSFPINNKLPMIAKLHVYATDSLYIHVNGHDEGLYYPYMQVVTLEISDLLHIGNNVLACSSDGENRGFIAVLSIVNEQGESEIYSTDSGWKVFDKLEAAWTSSIMDDSHWRTPASIGRFGHDAWSVYKRILYPVNKAYGPNPKFRKAFSINKKVSSARLYISALGIYQSYLNGEKISRDAFTPGWTDYRLRIPYQVYDVSEMLKHGDNELEATVGSGWFAGNLGICGPYHYGQKVACRAQLHLDYEDGSSEIHYTDEQWQAAESPVIAADMYMGETYDARLELTSPDWQASLRLEQLPGGRMTAQQGPPIQPSEEIVPVSINRISDSLYVLDMGQNMVGWIRMKVKGPEGTSICIRYAERLESDGSLYRANLRTAKQTDTYILKGDGEEIFEPGFTYHGFQYIEVRDYPGELTIDQIMGIVVHSAADNVSEIQTSEPSINQLLTNIRWSQRGNFFGIPLDCPQRDERLGWTGDAHAFARTATYNMNAASFYTKWLTDIRDGQGADGAFPDVAPFVEHFGKGHVFFADGGVIIPWIMYEVYGDIRFIEDNYSAMARWIEWMLNDSDDNLVRRTESFGDHLSHGADTPRPLINAAFFAYSVQLMIKMAEVTARQEDVARYSELFERLKQSFQSRFVSEDGTIESETQTAYVLALKIGLLPEHLRKSALNNLIADIRNHDWHLTTGFMGVSYVLSILADHGELETAYRLLLQDSFPSWLYSVRNGATTIWERWDGWTEEKGFQDPEMNSFNHYALGSVGEWINRYLIGIDTQDNKAGFQAFKIHPRPGGLFTSASCKYETLYGVVESTWKIEEGEFIFTIEIPVNTKALVVLPSPLGSQIDRDGVRIHLEQSDTAHSEDGFRVNDREVTLQMGSGRYEFKVMGYSK